MKLIAAVVIAVATVMGPCGPWQPSGSPRCDQVIPAQHYEIEAHGWKLDCNDHNEFAWPQGVTGWADSGSYTIFIRQSHIDDDRVLRKIAWHELGHVVFGERHITGVNEEWWADGYSYCREPISG